MDKKVTIPPDIHVTSVKEVIDQLAILPGNAPVFFASGFGGKPKITLSIYEDNCGQVWFDVGNIDD